MNNEKQNGSPILLISNSSWYLNHYRKLLIQDLIKSKNHVVSFSPVDSSTQDLQKLTSIHIQWNLQRRNNFNLFYLIKSFIELYFVIKIIKPKIIHSHTLKANLLTSLIASFMGIKTILSFAGLGRLSKKGKLNKFFLVLIIKLIDFFSSIERVKKFKWSLNKKRVKLIFQNPNDKNFYEKNSNLSIKTNNILILGSGVPMQYFDKSKSKEVNFISWINKDPQDLVKIEFIYCARLLKSKGILIFKKLANLIKENKFTVFGDIDISSPDSISKNDIKIFEKENSNLKFKGSIDDPLINYKFKRLPILIVPSNYGEGLSRSIVEGLSQGIPIICSESVAANLFDKNIVYISRSNNIIDYFNCYENILKDHINGKLKNRLYKGIQIAKNFFSEKIIVDKTLEIYNDLEIIDHNSYLLKKGKNKKNNWVSY